MRGDIGDELAHLVTAFGLAGGTRTGRVAFLSCISHKNLPCLRGNECAEFGSLVVVLAPPDALEGMTKWP